MRQHSLTIIPSAQLLDGEFLVGEPLPSVSGSEKIEGLVQLLVDGRSSAIANRLHTRVLTVTIQLVAGGLDHVFQEELR